MLSIAMMGFQKAEVAEVNGNKRKQVFSMTFSEYFNEMFQSLSDGEEDRLSFFDSMIGNFIDEDAQETCKLLDVKPDTKQKYIKLENPNKIKKDYARYVHTKHNPTRYREWLHKRMFQRDTFDIIEDWLNKYNIESTDVCCACDKLLEDIFGDIISINISKVPDIELPSANAKENTNCLTEKDRTILEDFHCDFDDILKECIKSAPSALLCISRQSKNFNSLLNNKWKKRITEFENIRLQSDILDTIATLQEFYDILNPDKKSNSFFSVRDLRTKLRNNYVKVHPDSYFEIFPYAAFIDDWNDGEDNFG